MVSNTRSTAIGRAEPNTWCENGLYLAAFGSAGVGFGGAVKQFKSGRGPLWPVCCLFCRHYDGFKSEAWIVARTVWLTAFCLLGLGPFVLMKVVTGTSAPPVLADIADAARPPAMASVPADTLAKSDRLAVLHPTETKQTAIVAVAPADAVQPSSLDNRPMIVPRHWHEASALPTAKRKLTHRPSSKRPDMTIASNSRAK
jgi:hypothetical protein